MKAALYARVSTDDKGQNPDNQLQELRRFAGTMDWEIASEFVDHDSGARSSRPQLQAMLKAASRREFDKLLFWSLDRLSREGALKTLQILNQLAEWGVGYRSYTEPYLDSAGVFSEAIVALLATLAKQERIRISERVRAGLHRAQERGTESGRPVGRPRVVFRRDEAVALRAKRYSWRQIAKMLGVGATTIRRACK
jgi:DNA invertase Pin-like site-specific DNA recombinase